MKLEILLEGPGEGLDVNTLLDRLNKRGRDCRIYVYVFHMCKGIDPADMDEMHWHWVNVKGAVSKATWLEHWT